MLIVFFAQSIGGGQASLFAMFGRAILPVDHRAQPTDLFTAQETHHRATINAEPKSDSPILTGGSGETTVLGEETLGSCHFHPGGSKREALVKELSEALAFRHIYVDQSAPAALCSFESTNDFIDRRSGGRYSYLAGPSS
jgi:hypothetical protein